MKKLTLILIIIIVAIFGVFMINTDSNKTEITTPNSPTESINSSSTTTTDTTTIGSITNKKLNLAQVATHNTETDCYSAINGLVYDLTAWIKKHPGGNKAILSICGKDGSSAFNEQHKRDPKVLSTLEGFSIGILVQ